jgi:hypothetical protein
MNRPFVPVVDVSEGIKAHLAKLDSYADPKRFKNNFLFCVAHVYSIGKGVIMLALARRGVLEFNREAAFKRFLELDPHMANEVDKIMKLRPFLSPCDWTESQKTSHSHTSLQRAN